MKQSNNRAIEQKKQVVNQIGQDLEKAKSVIFVDFSGLGSSDLNGLRGRLLEAGARFQVAKNTLVERALKNMANAKWQMPNAFLVGPTALVFSFRDALSGIKIADEFKEQFKQLEFKGGIFENEFVDRQGVLELAEIPGREKLLGQVAMTATSSLQRMVSSVNAPMRHFVFALRALSEE